MKINAKRLIAFLMMLVMVIVSVPTSVLTIVAADTTSETSTNEPEKKDPGFVLYEDLEQMSPGALAGIYVDGKLVYEEHADEGEEDHLLRVFDQASKKFAPKTYLDYVAFTEEEIEALPEVRIVLNKDFSGRAILNSELNVIDSSIEIAGIKLMLDLNGHVLDLVVEENYTLFHVTQNSCFTIVDSNPNTAHKGTVKDHLWRPSKDGNVVLNGGIITTSSAVGRCIHLRYGKVVMKGGTIAGFNGNCHNEDSPYMYGSYGGAVNMYYNCKLVLDGPAKICYNTAYRGGGVNITGTGSIITGNGEGSINNNHAIGVGGGINIERADFTVENIRIENNTSGAEGGGLSFAPVAGTTATAKNCVIKGNYSATRGGGVSAHKEGLTLDSCIITENYSKEHGGGVLVKPNKYVAVSGTLVVKDNVKANYGSYSKDKEKSNFYIQGNNDLVVKDLRQGAEVWLRTGKSASDYNGTGNPLTRGGWDGYTNVSPAFFYADNSDYYVEHQRDKSKGNYFNLYLKKGTRPTYSDIKTLTKEEIQPQIFGSIHIQQQSEDFTKLVVDDTYPIIKGYFEYNLMTTSEYSALSPFYYSDAYFVQNPKSYNRSLATMSINLAVAAFGRGTDAVPGNNYANHFANVKQLLADIGCPDENFYANESYQNRPDFYGDKSSTLSTIGVAISSKPITVQGEEYTLIPVAIRGGSYEVEWASNVTLGKTGEAKGFADAADQTYKCIQDYIKAYDLTQKAEEGKLKFWVVGYSRAGATANLTSKRLVDNFAQTGNTVYGYTFEAPMGGVDSAKVNAAHTGYGKYPTIHNTVNENDFVTLVAPTEMGFIRYGTDHKIGGDYKNGIKVQNDNKGKYKELRAEMMKQLAAINPYYVFDDYWNVADLNPLLGNLPGWLTNGADFVDIGEQWYDNPNPEARNIYTFLRWFFKKVQEDGLGTSDKKKFREYYSVKAPLEKAGWNAGIFSQDWQNASLPYNHKDHFFGNSKMSVEKAVQTLMGLMYTLTDKQMNDLMAIVMENVSDLGLTDMFEAYWEILIRFNEHTLDWCADSIDDLLHKLLATNHYGSVWEVLTTEQGENLAEALPVLIYFLGNYISEDHEKKSVLSDDGMWGVGTFVFNMDRIIANHYQEITVAWVRSYDSNYTNPHFCEYQAYRLDTSKTETPKGTFATQTNTLEIEAENGSSVFYSIDNGKTWTLYTKPVSFSTCPEGIKTFAISHGVKSDEYDVPMNSWAGTILGNGNIWFVMAGLGVFAIAAVVTVEVNRKKSKAK